MGVWLVRLAAVAGVAALLTACGSSEPSTSTGSSGTNGSTPAADDAITVVASTNVWGDVAAAVGGAAVAVTSIVADGDPHSYQVNARDAATLRDADLVVSNGGGYDEFVDQALDGDTDQPRIVAVDLHLPTAESSDNEHVWYHPPTVGKVAAEIATKLGELRPDDRDTFTANAAAYQDELDRLMTSVTELSDEYGGTSVVATEPVAQYLLVEAGLSDETPAEFTEAVEEENDPPAAAVAEIQRIVTEKRASVLVHNPQTETPVVTDLVDKARDAGVPVVEMTETLPNGQDYLTWMGNQIAALSKALSEGPTR